MNQPLIEIDHVAVEFPGKGFRAKPHRVLNDVTLDIAPGETLGLVGESGSGKTTLGRAILGLVPVAGGEVRLEGKRITGLNSQERRALSEDIQVVFQDPYTSLNPAMTINDILTEPLTVAGMEPRAAQAKVRDLLDQVRLPADAGIRLPREFSGGQRQRIAIARALARSPKLIVCDEPVSALDLSTQSRVLDMFIEIQERTGVSYLFITHDLSVVRYVSHRIAVMYKGDIVEIGSAEKITSDPDHPYTQRLMLASPVCDPDRQAVRRQQRLQFAETMAASAAVGGTSEQTVGER